MNEFDPEILYRIEAVVDFLHHGAEQLGLLDQLFILWETGCVRKVKVNVIAVSSNARDR